MGLKTGKHFSKPKPILFYDWFIDKYKKKFEEKKKEWGLLLQAEIINEKQL